MFGHNVADCHFSKSTFNVSYNNCRAKSTVLPFCTKWCMVTRSKRIWTSNSFIWFKNGAVPSWSRAPFSHPSGLVCRLQRMSQLSPGFIYCNVHLVFLEQRIEYFENSFFFPFGMNESLNLGRWSLVVTFCQALAAWHQGNLSSYILIWTLLSSEFSHISRRRPFSETIAQSMTNSQELAGQHQLSSNEQPEVPIRDYGHSEHAGIIGAFKSLRHGHGYKMLSQEKKGEENVGKCRQW